MPARPLYALLAGGILAAEFAVLAMGANAGRAYVAAGGDASGAAHLIVAAAPQDGCAGATLARDGDDAIAALWLVEQTANGVLWRLGKTVVLRVAVLVGAEPPDWTYGPMMIRLSRFRATGRHADLDILDACSAKRAAKQIVLRDTGVDLDAVGVLSRSDLLRVASRYNGQRDAVPATAEKRLADQIYNELVYHVFQELRFASRAAKAVQAH
jgi:hypothetical protein